jgi:tetratricopeptide (TPR) repeat protein
MKAQPSTKQRRHGRKSSDGASMPLAALPPIAAPSEPSWAPWIFWAYFGAFLAIVLAMTPLTDSLDDVKKLLLLVIGPMLATAALALIAFKRAPMPPKLVMIGVAGYVGTLLVSTAASGHRWIGYQEIMFNWSSVGFFLTAMLIGSCRNRRETFVTHLVALLFVTNLIGFFLFDFGSEHHVAGVRWLYDRLFGQPNDTDFMGKPWYQPFLYTFWLDSSVDTMQSTILNREFYSAFCTLGLPFALLLALAPGGKGRSPLGRSAWRLLGCATTVASCMCVYYCKGKTEYVLGAASCLVFVVGFLLVSDATPKEARMQWALLGGIGIVLATALWSYWPAVITRFKSMDVSWESRKIIWNGAWNAFLSHPILGGGPGTFRIDFPQFRAPDYYLHQISNVTPEAHDCFLDMLSETGVTGLAFFLLLAGSLTWLTLLNAWRRRDARLRELSLAAWCGFFALLGSNVTSPNSRWVVGAVSLWSVMGLLAGLLMQADAELPVQSASGGADGRPRASRRVPQAFSPAWKALWGVALLACLASIFVGTRQGLRYFNSQRDYLKGYEPLQAATDMLERRLESTEEIKRLLIEAEPSLNMAIAIDPTNYRALYHLGSAYMLMSSAELSDLDALLRSRSGTRDQVVALCQNVDDYVGASLTVYRRLAELWPDYAEIHYNFGLVQHHIADLLREQNRLHVLEYLDKNSVVFQHAPDEWDRMALAHDRVMLRMSNKIEVAKLVGDYLMQAKLSPDATNSNGVSTTTDGDRLMQAKLSSEAVAAYRRASDNNPPDDDLLARYSEAARVAKDNEALGDALWKAWRFRPLDDQRLNRLLEVARGAGLKDLLAKTVNQLEHDNPLDPRVAQYRLAMAIDQAEPKTVKTQLDRYAKSGGRDPQVIRTARESVDRLLPKRAEK